MKQLDPSFWEAESAGVPTNLALPDGSTYLRTVLTVVLFSFSALVRTPRSREAISRIVLQSVVGLGLGAPCNCIQKSTLKT